MQISNELSYLLQNTNITSLWDNTALVLKEASKSITSTDKPTNKQPWMTTNILTLMDERRLHKNLNCEKYNHLNRLIRFKIKLAKNKWLVRECIEIERLQSIHDDFNVHKK